MRSTEVQDRRDIALAGWLRDTAKASGNAQGREKEVCCEKKGAR